MIITYLAKYAKYGNKYKKQVVLHVLRILPEKMYRQVKLLHLQKVRAWAFGSLVHQINCL